MSAEHDDTEQRPRARRRPRPSNVTPEQQLAIDQRRARVAVMLVQGLSYREMQAQEGRTTGARPPGLGTIQRDVQAVRQQWQDRAVLAYDEWVAEELAKLDAVERNVLVDAQGRGDDRLEAARTFTRLSARRARLLGLDKPTKVQHSIDEQQLGTVITRVIDGVLGELRIERTDEVGRVVHRHLRLVADDVERVG